MTDDSPISGVAGQPANRAARPAQPSPATHLEVPATVPAQSGLPIRALVAAGLTAAATNLSIAALAFAAALGAVFVATATPGAGVVALACAVAAAWFRLMVRALVRAGLLSRAVLASSAGVFAVAIVIGLSLPVAGPVADALPLLAVVLALPFSNRPTFLSVTAVAWVTEVAVGLSSESGPAVGAAGVGGPSGLGVVSLAVGAGVILLVLWRMRRVVVATSAWEPADAAARTASIQTELQQRVDELEQRSLEMTHLARLADLLQACETAEEAYRAIARTAGPLFSGDSGVLYELTESRTAVEQVAAWGENSSSLSVFAPTECWALRRGRVYLVEDTGVELLCAHVGDAAPPGYLCVPLTAQSETFGLLHIEIGYKVPRDERAAHLADRMRLAVTLSEHLSLALANFRLRATLRERSTRDELTGLFNRRSMEDSLDREIRRAIRDGESLSVLMLDLDHFKRLNDAFGHAAGDIALRLMGGFLKTGVRGEDVACRFGGEEFVVILPKAIIEDARRRAEALRLGIQRLRADHDGSWFPTLTVSIGVAAYPQHGSTAQALLAAADEALYRAKAEGRDRVAVAGTREGLPIDVGTT